MSLIISYFPVVREISACCHHRIHFKCAEGFKLAIIQARYIADTGQKESVSAVIDSSASSPTKEETSDSYGDYHHHPFIHPLRPSVS